MKVDKSGAEKNLLLVNNNYQKQSQEMFCKKRCKTCF